MKPQNIRTEEVQAKFALDPVDTEVRQRLAFFHVRDWTPVNNRPIYPFGFKI